jgi:hypothetical protein
VPEKSVPPQFKNASPTLQAVGVPAFKYIGLLEAPIVDEPNFEAIVAVAALPEKFPELSIVAMLLTVPCPLVKE